MSASREKQIRQEQANAGQVDTAAIQEETNRKNQKRSSVLYAVIGVVFLIALIGSIVWRSNVIAKVTPAVTIDGEKYTAAEVSFYYQNVYQGFMNNNYYLISYIGLDPYSPLKSQTMNETAAAWLGAEEGQTWYDYFLDQALFQMSTIQEGLNAAEAEGFTYPDSIQVQHETALTYLDSTAASGGLSAEQYLKNTMGATMTEKIYSEHMMRLLQFDAYTSAYSNNLTYTDAEIEAAYQEDPVSYDEVACEYAYISGAAESTTDADGNTVEPTEEESQQAMADARAVAEELLAAVQAGAALETLVEDDEDIVYSQLDNSQYTGDAVSEWMFDDARKAGDSAVLESGNAVYVAVFHERFRNTDPTIDVRHILIQPAAGTLTAEDEGYEDEQTQLKADALAQAEDILSQWKSGDATEDSFAALALEYSADGSKYDGGLYTAVYPGQMVTEFNDWCFASNRKTGDTDVVETPYGAHVMYFVGQNLPYWQTLVVSTLQSTDYAEWINAFSADSEITEGSGMKFVG